MTETVWQKLYESTSNKKNHLIKRQQLYESYYNHRDIVIMVVCLKIMEPMAETIHHINNIIAVTSFTLDTNMESLSRLIINRWEAAY